MSLFGSASLDRPVDYISGLGPGAAIKVPCDYVITSNNALFGVQSYEEAKRALVMGQTDTTKNGIYTINSGAWVRAADFDGANDIVKGSFIRIAGQAANLAYVVTSESRPVIGVDPITISAVDLTGATGPSGAVGPQGATGATGPAGIFSAIASQAEAEAGSENTKGLTSLRTKQSIDANSPNSGFTTFTGGKSSSVKARLSNSIRLGYDVDCDLTGATENGGTALNLAIAECQARSRAEIIIPGGSAVRLDVPVNITNFVSTNANVRPIRIVGSGRSTVVSNTSATAASDLFSIGNYATADWATSTTYAVGALVKASDSSGPNMWRCITAHTSPNSGAFTQSGNLAKWTALKTSFVTLEGFQITAQATATGGSYINLRRASDVTLLGVTSTSPYCAMKIGVASGIGSDTGVENDVTYLDITDCGGNAKTSSDPNGFIQLGSVGTVNVRGRQRWGGADSTSYFFNKVGSATNVDGFYAYDLFIEQFKGGLCVAAGQGGVANLVWTGGQLDRGGDAFFRGTEGSSGCHTWLISNVTMNAGNSNAASTKGVYWDQPTPSNVGGVGVSVTGCEFKHLRGNCIHVVSGRAIVNGNQMQGSGRDGVPLVRVETAGEATVIGNVGFTLPSVTAKYTYGEHWTGTAPNENPAVSTSSRNRAFNYWYDPAIAPTLFD